MRKKIIFFLFCIGICFTVRAQDFTPLRIDSAYSFFRAFDFFENPIQVASYAAYDYNAANELVQIRRENERSNFTYSNNQEMETVEVFSEDTWTNSRRITTTYFNNLPIRILTESYPDGVWLNTKLVTYDYTSNDELQVTTTQRWTGSNWQDEEQIINSFDDQGNQVTQSYFLGDTDGDLFFSFGDSIIFNNFNKATEIFSFSGVDASGKKISDKFTISYDDNQRQDTLLYCLFNTSDDTNCEPFSRSVFNYDPSGNSIAQDIDVWNNSEWVRDKRIETYLGPNIYSGLPDSILTYDYQLSTADQLFSRQYYQYEDLDDLAVRFESSLFVYDANNTEQFELENYREEYYQREEISAVNDLNNHRQYTIFPNPVTKGQPLNLTTANSESMPSEVTIVNLAGMVVYRQKYALASTFLSPGTPGIYFIQIINDENQVSIQKIVVD